MAPVRRLIASLSSLLGVKTSAEGNDRTPGEQPFAALRFNPLDADFVANPYPLFSYLQRSDPIHRGLNGTWVVTRYQDVLAALSDQRLGNMPSRYAVVHQRNRDRYTCAEVANNIIPFMDHPRHTRPRKFISKVFLEYLGDIEVELETIARDLVAPRLGDAKMDILGDFATPYSVRVFCRLLGLPEEDGPRLKQWSEWFFYLFSIIPSADIRQQLDVALVEFRTYFSARVRERREQPGSDLISLLLRRSPEGEGLTDIEVVDHCMLLFSDGVENVDRGIANAMHALLQAPDQMAELRANPALLGKAVDECLRFESPAQFVGRVVREDFEWQGVSLNKDDGVLLVIGAANRDPEKFVEAQQLDIHRTPNPYLSFGKGRHACIGAPLVKLEMAVAIRVLLEMLRDLRPAATSARWEPRLGHRWIAGLAVSYTPVGDSAAGVGYD